MLAKSFSGRAVKKGLRVSRCNIDKAVEDSSPRVHNDILGQALAEDVSHQEAMQTAASAAVLPLSALPPAD